MLIACGESLAMVGIVVPGIALLWGVGTLVGLGKLDLMPILLWTALGGFLGDVISYALGRRFHEQLRGMWPLTKYPDLIPKGEAYFEKHGGKSVIMGRFLGPMRAIIPAVAGILNMPVGRFIGIDIVACLLWAPPTILPGVAIGASLGIASEVASRLIVVVVGAIVGVVALIYLIRAIFMFVQPRADAMLERVVRWSQSHRYLGAVLAAVVDPKKPESRGLIILGGALLITVWVFLLILASVSVEGTLLRIDNTVAHVVHDLRTPWTESIMIGFAALSEPMVMMMFAGVIAGWLFIGKYYLAGAHWLAAVAYGFIMPVALHVVLRLPSFEFSGEMIVAQAFPSMNMTLSSVVLGFFAVMLSREVAPSWRWAPYAGVLLMLFLLTLALIYLEIQTVSNATGGLALGLAWVFFLGIAYRRHAEKNVSARAMAAVSLSVLALVMGLRATELQHGDIERAIPEKLPRQIFQSDWSARVWEELPAFRVDWEGVATQPLTVQWVGDLGVLSEKLKARGWRDPVEFNFASALLWMAPNPEFQRLPLLPQLHDGSYAAFALVKDTDRPERVRVLRLWRTDLQIVQTGEPVWVGSVIYLDLVRRFDLLVYPRTSGRFDKPLNELAADLGDFVIRRARREGLVLSPGIRWEGDVLLAAPK